MSEDWESRARSAEYNFRIEHDFVIELKIKIKQLEEVIWAKDQLLIAYRIGKTPPEKAFVIIYKYKKQLEEK